jgi:hypothetical protein
MRRLKEIAWQNSLPLEESLRRLLIDATCSERDQRKFSDVPAWRTETDVVLYPQADKVEVRDELLEQRITARRSDKDSLHSNG